MEAERARELLASERSRIEEELRSLAPQDGDDAPEDTGDEASELQDAELAEQQAEELRTQLAAVERAERRLADGSYGTSVESGDAIPDARLEAVPTAERTVEEQARFDSGA
ncbi:MAG TPA: TraR/DksA C4-type zinc finger protein [Gaiellales bacterium]|jgi:DnaK suppressor protein